MGNKLRRIALSATLLAGLAAMLLAPPAEAKRDTTTTTEPQYVPPIEEPYDGGSDDDPFESPFEDPVEDPVEDPAEDGEDVGGVVIDPGADPAGGGETARPAPGEAPAIQPVSLPQSGASPALEDQSRGGILSKTGAETLALVRAGLAALALGGGLILLGRRRRGGVPSA